MQYDWTSVVYLLMVLVLPVSALMRRKLNLGKGLMMVLAWVGIFGIVALFITAIRG
jgi:hypothetical protein